MVSQVKIRALLLEEGVGPGKVKTINAHYTFTSTEHMSFNLCFCLLLQQDENCLCSLIFESFLKYLGLVEFNYITAKAKFVKAKCT